jgi:hypothetical protein
MTIQWGDTGRVSIGALKKLTVTPYVNEQNLTSTTLPVGANASSIPGSPVFSFTYTKASMSPVFGGNITPLSWKPYCGYNVTGQNTSGASQTVYYNIYKNGVTWKNGSATITNNNYFTVSISDASNDGDKYDFYIWTPASSGVNYFYQNNWCLPSRVDTGAKNVVNLSFSISSLSTATNFPVAGSKIGSSFQGSATVNMTASTLSSYSIVDGTVLALFAVQNQNYKLFCIGSVDSVNNNCSNNSTSYQITQTSYPTSLSYRDLYF